MKKYLRTSLILSGLLLFSPLSGCGINNTQVVDPSVVSSVSLDKTNVTLTVGSHTTLYATVLPQTATNQNVYWSSSNNEIATVSSRGLVTAISTGSAVITVTTLDGEKTARCTVNVVSGTIAVTGVNLNYDTLNIYKDKNATLVATVEPYNATNSNVTWSSDNDTIVSVSDTGTVTGLAVGTAHVKVTTVDGEYEASCTVNVSEEPEEIDPYVPPVDTDIYSITLDNLSSGSYDSTKDEYTFTVSGEYKQLYINAPEKVIIVELNGATLENNENSPIYVADCDKLELSAKKKTVNYVKDTRATYTADVDGQGKGAIYVENGDLKLKGTGTLNIEANYLNGIHGKDDVEIQKQTLNITAVNHGVRGNDSVTITSGTITISCGGDGLHSENSDVSSKGTQRGNVTISGGTLNINSWGDAIQAAYNAVIEEANSEDAPTSLTLATNKYSSYTGQTVETESAKLYLKMSSSTYSNGNYTYAAYINGAWYKASYKGTLSSGGPGGGGPGGGWGGSSTYYVYQLDRPADSTSFTLYRFSGSNVTSFSTSSYNAVSDAKAFNDAYDMVQISVSSGRINFSSWSNYSSSSTGADVSCKGIKAENEILISGGTISINAYDDGIHANNDGSLENGETPLGNVTISGGAVAITSADDGVHADYTLTISGGSVTVTTAYEGLEGNLIRINGGETYVFATDDGVNATSGRTTPNITVTDGLLDVTVPSSGDTDGIDSNGTFTQSGGVVIVKGPGSASGNTMGAAALDTDSTVRLTGGTLVVFGGIEQTPSTSGMTKTLCSSSTVSTGNKTISVGTQSYTTTLKYSTNGCVVYSALGTATLS